MMDTAQEHGQQDADEQGPVPTGPTILLYSDDVDARAQVLLAVGSRLGRDQPPVEWIETATAAEVIARVDAGGIDLLILDGEARKVGGMGLARQLKDEIYDCPPVVLLTGRPQDAWLASWSEAEAVISRPLDPFELPRVVAEVLRAAAAPA